MLSGKRRKHLDRDEWVHARVEEYFEDMHSLCWNAKTHIHNGITNAIVAYIESDSEESEEESKKGAVSLPYG
jgi:hypothetical protein